MTARQNTLSQETSAVSAEPGPSGRLRLDLLGPDKPSMCMERGIRPPTGVNFSLRTLEPILGAARFGS